MKRQIPISALSKQIYKTFFLHSFKGFRRYIHIFTPTEIRVANLIREGKTIKEIAGILGVSENAINHHRQNIRNKLGLNKQKVNLRTHLLSLS